MNNCKRCNALTPEPEPTKPVCVKCGIQTPWEYSTGQPMCINCIDDLDEQLTIDREASAILGED